MALQSRYAGMSSVDV